MKALASLGCAAVAALSATVAVASGGPFDRVAGSGSLTFPGFPTAGDTEFVRFAIAAVDTANGPTGTITFRTTTASGSNEIPQRVGDVICMTVTGAEARVAAKLSRPFEYNGTTYDRIQLRVVDGEPFDLATLIAIGPGFTGDPCGSGFPATTPVEHGQVVVFDAG